MIRHTLFAVFAMAQAALAEVPRVATDISPVQGLVASVMEGLSTPDVILPPGADPHGYALRPSDAAALEAADIVIWVGEGLTPWLESPIGTLARDATVLELLSVDGTHLIAFGDDAEHDEHEDNAEHEDHHDHEGHDHGHGDVDPHAWLDPDNALVWLEAIAGALAHADPENAALYHANATESAKLIVAQIARTEAAVAGLRDVPYAVHHDAYRYFETRFGLAHVFAVTSVEGQAPGPRRIAELHALARESAVGHLLADPGIDVTRLAGTLFGSGTASVCRIDPLGVGIEPGRRFYPDFLAQLTFDIEACFKP